MKNKLIIVNLLILLTFSIILTGCSNNSKIKNETDALVKVALKQDNKEFKKYAGEDVANQALEYSEQKLKTIANLTKTNPADDDIKNEALETFKKFMQNEKYKINLENTETSSKTSIVQVVVEGLDTEKIIEQVNPIVNEYKNSLSNISEEEKQRQASNKHLQEVIKIVNDNPPLKKESVSIYFEFSKDKWIMTDSAYAIDNLIQAAL